MFFTNSKNNLKTGILQHNCCSSCFIPSVDIYYNKNLLTSMYLKYAIYIFIFLAIDNNWTKESLNSSKSELAPQLIRTEFSILSIGKPIAAKT